MALTACHSATPAALPEIDLAPLSGELPPAGATAAGRVQQTSAQAESPAASGKAAAARPEPKIVYRRAVEQARAMLDAPHARALLDKIDGQVEREKDMMR